MTMISAAQTAIKQGLGGIIFTDHYDVDPPKGIVAFDFDPAEQQREIENIKYSFGNFEILKGIEVGIQLKSLAKINRFLDRFSFDTIIASAHFVEGMDPYFGDYYKNRDWREAYGFYLKSIYDCIVQFDNFDVIGHFDYIARYAPYNVRSIKYTDFPEIFESIFRLLKERGKALEINTNTYRDKYGKAPELDIEILKRFKKSGGEFVSLSSDAHETGRIGENFGKYTAIIKEAGFDHVTHYKERKPVLTKI